MTHMKRIFLCSPLRGAYVANVQMARDLARLATRAGVAVYAPHLLYPQFLNDQVTTDREAGIQSGLAFLPACHELWVYDAHGVSEGMSAEIAHAQELGIPVRYMPPCWVEYAERG